MAGKRTISFGELDLEAIGLQEQSRRAADAPEHTRIAVAKVLAEAVARCEREDDNTGHTGPSESRTVPSTSGARARSYKDHDDPVRAIRELYAQGRADLALELASELASDLESNGEESDASEDDDGFGGLIPVDDDDDENDAAVDVAVDDGEAPFGVVDEGDYDGGYDESDHADHTMMPSSAESSRLAAMTSNRIPRLLLGPREMSALPMDPRMGFLLGHIDGVQTMGEILDVCAMPEADALRLLEKLRAMGVIAVD